ncbi:MAG: hypothetical protein KGH69_03020 [Candidatus Micrarchaeota archaeon]|nr:hypothetical protein [Candidatus Micrarchaeota archaeon]
MQAMHIYIGAALLAATLLGSYLGFLNGAAQRLSNDPRVFFGTMVEPGLTAQTLTGLHVLSDEGCGIDPKTQLNNCTAGISTPNGTIHFNYEHDMMLKPCLSDGDIVTLRINGDGTAVVTRAYRADGGV